MTEVTGTATKFEFIIKLQTVQTRGIEVPPSLLARADTVIELGCFAAVHESGSGIPPARI